MAEIFRTRTERPSAIQGENYPTKYGTGRFTPLDRTPDATARTVEAEIHGIRCAQCGFPIEDHREVSECPHCESTNILGNVFPVER
jgi:hypothetical protein